MRTFPVLFGVIGFIIVTGLAWPGMAAANPETVTCEDGEAFLIKLRGVVETSNTPYGKSDLIIVDTRKFRLTLYRDGKVFRTYPVAIGEPETPTPIGEWKIIHKGGNWGGGFGSRWLGLNVPWGIYGIHGTNKPGSIGSRSSHGCIRMYNRNVLELYQLVKVATPVHIIGNLPKLTPRREYSRKKTGQDIVDIQFRLRNLNFDPGNADARYGQQTELAVLQMQRYYGLAMNGKIGMNEQYLLKMR